ncbi:hypothetical protein [Catenulispora subtropica]|uniref:Integral membrane protein n=1 Tax=Catenulispora subtropica TaxID=450798 RepID=A0ABP5D0X0_9ACTN
MILGVTAVLGAAISNNAGLIVEKRALDRMPPQELRRPLKMAATLVTRPLWALGFALLLLGAGLYMYGLALLPLSVAQPLFVVGLALVLVVAAVVLAEPLRPAERRGLAVVAVAFALLALSFDSHTDKSGAQQHAVMWSVVVAGFAVLSVAVFARAGSGVPYGVAVGLMNAVGGMAAKATAAHLVRHGSAVGLIAYLGVFGVSGVLMLGMTQIALQRSRAAAVLPAQVVAGNVAVTAAGTPVFGEHLPDTPLRLFLRLAGFVVALLSLAVMQRAGDAPSAPRSPRSPNPARHSNPARHASASRHPNPAPLLLPPPPLLPPLPPPPPPLAVQPVRPPGRHAGTTRPVRLRVPFLRRHAGRRRSTASASTDSKLETVADQRSARARAAASSPIA